MNLKGFIFDLDGTLADTFQVIFPAYRKALAAFVNTHFTDADIIANFGPSEDGVFQRIIPNHWEEALDIYMDMYRQISPTQTIRFAGIEDALIRLRQRGMRLGVVTGKTLASAVISLADIGLSSYFECVEGGSAGGVIKPVAIRKILQTWQMSPTDVAYMGDFALDMQNAREVGALPLGAGWYEKVDLHALELEKPAVLFRSIPQFIEWIDATLPEKHN